MRSLSCIAIVIFFSTLSMAQSSHSIILMDIVEVPVARREEAIFYFENNWKLFREVAMEKGLIRSYRMMEVDHEISDHLELILTTEFSNDTQFEQVEENFEPIMKAVRPNGPILLNEIKPSEFRKLVSTRKALVLLEPPN